jgi:DNA-binding transcriptional regulator YiaG
MEAPIPDGWIQPVLKILQGREGALTMGTKFAEVQVRIPNLEGDAVAETHTIRVPVTIDPSTGEELLTEEAVEMIETTKARYMGLLLPEEIKSLRQRLGLTQKRMSELLQSGEKSYTRWETGAGRPSRMVNLLLRLLYEGKLSVEALHNVGRPRTKVSKLKSNGSRHDQGRLVMRQQAKKR